MSFKAQHKMGSEQKVMKSCDRCKSRKVACSGIGLAGVTRCNNCSRRNEVCRFSAQRRPRRRQEATEIDQYRDEATQTDDTSIQEAEVALGEPTPQYDGLQDLYVDRLLIAPRKDPALPTTAPKVGLAGTGVFGNEYSLTFYSERRLSALSAKLGHDRVLQAHTKATAFLAERLGGIDRLSISMALPEKTSTSTETNSSFVKACIQSYFEQLHPIYTFIDRARFEAIAFGPNLSQHLEADKPWSALFHAILALGSQFHDGGSYQPAKNIAWRFFSISLALFPSLLITKATLHTVQAIAAMAIFASNVSSLHLEHTMIYEATKRAQSLGYDRCTAPGDDERIRTFWVLYRFEKIMTFTTGRSSTIMDSDISSVISPQPLSGVDSNPFDFSLASVRMSRLLSRVYSSIYSVSARGRTQRYYLDVVRRLKSELENWRASIPLNLQPGQPIRPHCIPTTLAMNICVKLHLLYYTTMLHLNRVLLQLEDQPTNESEAVASVMRTARSILDVTQFIEVQPYTPLWVLAAVPLAGFLVLFDVVIDYPTHPDTAVNLSMLDIGIGHFSRIEYASNGSLPGHILADFSSIARSFVQESQAQRPGNDGGSSKILSIVPMPAYMAANNSGMQPPIRTQPAVGLSSSPFTDLPVWLTNPTNEDLLQGTDILDLFNSSFPNFEDDGNLFGFAP
ncbi:hypothetical protein BU24DRAFT_417317 [Aaosphaeria arxii CBS 175.79]|uniref:Zn(2)-C6 fungal-type domain-containing protein n=1 Tax=Aaosphaeria arxii CBS 175.79 TaxID=1450172 RepID=A0A6A5Y8L9_9PLEO|nr:uncharacterized protein BU24DRAFT_417317 [Aaosphaeria arxii CBS 175.79]KAF2021679.1 hypothetical protein BU24DRAFT_417317 [Aaosphaeria arxii CBS 175.79]